MPDYYARRVFDEQGVVSLVGPFGTYDQAQNDHTQFVAMLPLTYPPLPKPKMQTFLDLSTVSTLDQGELTTMLLTDPVLSAIYKLGLTQGRQQANRERVQRGW